MTTLEKIADLDGRLDACNPSQRHACFIAYCEAVIAACKASDITLREAGERLMRGHYYSELLAEGALTKERALTDEILDIATYLEELPCYPDDRNPDQDWARVERLVSKGRTPHR